MKQLIVNADDFGYTRGVNRAIVTAHRAGIVTSTSLMANGTAFEDAVGLWKDAASLDVGCHLNLVEGMPLSPPPQIPHLVRTDGTFLSLRDFGLRLISGRIPREEMEREFAAQIERIADAGVAPSHLDTHQHIHVHPKVAAALARAGERYGIRWARRLCEHGSPPLREGAWGRRLIAAAGNVAARSFPRRIARHGLCTPDASTGFVLTGRLSPSALLSTISSLPEGLTELMCHPGYYDQELAAAPTVLKQQREVELRAVGDGSWRAWLRERGIVLTSFRELTGQTEEP